MNFDFILKMSQFCILFCILPSVIIVKYLKPILKQKESPMKSISNKVVLFAGKLSSNVRLVVFLLTLVLFVLAAGAPSATGSVGG
jgi:hypothetical protein